MLVIQHNNKEIIGNLNITGLTKEELQKRYPDALITEEKLNEPIECYEIVDNKLQLKQDWQEIRKRLEATRQAMPKLNKEVILREYIYKYYPQDKQNSDLADKLYYENILKAKNIENLEADIVKRIERFYNGESLDEIVSDVIDENKEAYLQLIKVGIRVTWVQMCKAEYKKAIEENREPNYPKYPL